MQSTPPPFCGGDEVSDCTSQSDFLVQLSKLSNTQSHKARQHERIFLFLLYNYFPQTCIPPGIIYIKLLSHFEICYLHLGLLPLKTRYKLLSFWTMRRYSSTMCQSSFTKQLAVEKKWVKVINSYLSAMCSAYTGCNSEFLNIPYKPTFEPLSYYAITASTTQMAKRISKLTANRLLKVHQQWWKNPNNST